MPKGFSEQEKELIRKNLHEKGTRLFETYGLRKTSVDDLAKAVGISKGAFYLFFESKEDLYMDILEEIEANHRRKFMQLSPPHSDNPIKRVSILLKGLILPWGEFPIFINFDQEDYQILRRKIPPQRIDNHTQQDRQFIREFLEKVSQEGITVKCSAEQVANLIQSLFFIVLHRDDLGDLAYRDSMNILTDLIAGYIVEGY